MAVVPDPRTLLLPDPDAIPSVLSDKAAPIFGGLLGFCGILVRRYLASRPYLSGIQSYVGYTIAGVAIGKYLYDRDVRKNRDRDAMLRHYIELHPEDFPVPERIKVGDVFGVWYPAR